MRDTFQSVIDPVGRQARCRRWCKPRGSGRGLCAQRLPGRPDRQDRGARSSTSRSAFRAPIQHLAGHEGLEDHRRHQQGRRGADLPGRGLSAWSAICSALVPVLAGKLRGGGLLDSGRPRFGRGLFCWHYPSTTLQGGPPPPFRGGSQGAELKRWLNSSAVVSRRRPRRPRAHTFGTTPPQAQRPSVRPVSRLMRGHPGALATPSRCTSIASPAPFPRHSGAGAHRLEFAGGRNRGA